MKKFIALMSLLLILALENVSLADHTVNVPAGTLIRLRMNTHLSSRVSRAGDAFTATVTQDVEVDPSVLPPDVTAQQPCLSIPVGSTVEGHVTAVRRAERMSKAGTIAITFDRLVFPNGRSIPVEGTLTSLADASQASLDDFEDEDQIGGGSSTRRAIIFIGAGAGVGAVIGAITKGGKGAAIGAGIGAVLGTVGALANKGKDAEVSPGYEFGMKVERAFRVDADEAGLSSVRVECYHPDQ